MDLMYNLDPTSWSRNWDEEEVADGDVKGAPTPTFQVCRHFVGCRSQILSLVSRSTQWEGNLALCTCLALLRGKLSFPFFFFFFDLFILIF
jgi:hypothetical protein